MLKKSFLIFILYFPILTVILPEELQFNRLLNFGTIVYGQNFPSVSSQNEELFSNFRQLSMQQLFDTACYYDDFRNSYDTAIVCYNLIINTPEKSRDLEQQTIVIDALNRTAIIYAYLCDYRNAYKYFIDALLLCEKYNVTSPLLKIYNNIGNIFASFEKYDIAKSYFNKALNSSEDTASFDRAFSNLGLIELKNGNIDSAFYFLNKSLQLSKQYNPKELSGKLASIALIYRKTKQYDSAYYYYQLSLEDARKNNQLKTEAHTLSGLSQLFFELNKPDSVLVYVNLSNTIATEKKFLTTIAGNYLILSKIEESKGNVKKAFEHFKKHANLRDSVLNTSIFGDINQLQHLYEISKTNQQIEQLIIEQQIKERTQKMIQIFILAAFLSACIVSLVFIFQNKKLKNAYKVLFEKNIEIVKFLENSSKNEQKKNKISDVSNGQGELLDKILTVMNDTAVICNPAFSINNLAALVQYNHRYVSEVINNGLNKNFRSLLNSYRIQEAQRLFSEPETANYTIEYIALQVGFKSRSAFRDAFKEITGVTPAYYLKRIEGLRE